MGSNGEQSGVLDLEPGQCFTVTILSGYTTEEVSWVDLGDDNTYETVPATHHLTYTLNW